jgi:hypothetical protein
MNSRNLFLRRLFFPLLAVAGLSVTPFAAADFNVNGSLTGLDLAQGMVKVDVGRQPLYSHVGPAAWITRDGVDCRLVNLRVGDRVRLSLAQAKNGDLAALRVDAQTRGRNQPVKGKLITVSTVPPRILIERKSGPGSGSQSIVYDNSTQFLVDGAAAAPGDLQPDDEVTVTTVTQPVGYDLAVRVEVSSPHSDNQAVSVFGVVKATTAEGMLIQSWKEGSEVKVSTKNLKRACRDKQTTAVANVVRGDRVLVKGNITSNGIEASSITAQPPDVRFNGTITKLDTSTGIGLVTIQSTQLNTSVTVMLFPATVISINGLQTRINEVRVGDTVEVRSITHSDGPWGALSLDVSRPV